MNISWAALEEALCACRRCRLCDSRTQVVMGEGNPHADIMFIGEGPGKEEDRLGRPFVGPAGILLEKALHAIGETRDTAYIANVIKCRPPGNRTPEADEVSACLFFLRGQVALVQPRVLVLMGACALRAVLGDTMRITRDRGQWVEKKGVLMMPTFHPAALLRDESKKRPFWEDFKQVQRKIAEIRGCHADTF